MLKADWEWDMALDVSGYSCEESYQQDRLNTCHFEVGRQMGVFLFKIFAFLWVSRFWVSSFCPMRKNINWQYA